MSALYSLRGILIQTLLVGFLFASSPAEGQNLKDIKVTVKAVNVTFKEALLILEQNTNFKFNFISEEIPLKENVTLSVIDESLYNILEAFANDYGLIFNRINNQITIKRAEGWEKEKIIATVENGSITGTVKDARSKSPIPGANLLVIGLNIGAAADANGNFTIRNVPAGKYELRASAVGYGRVAKGLVVEEGKTTSIEFYLDEDAVGLDEVVVTGVAFETKRREIPAEIGILSPKQIEQKNSTDLITLLRGEMPGVFAMTNGQSDFNTYIYLRGSGFSGSANEYAKIYIDGVELSMPNYLATIDPKIIERVEVLKGPHAAALYGAEASAGVIQIITKKGANLGLNRPKLNFSHSTGYIQSEFYGINVTPDGAVPIKTNNSLQLSGGEGTLSYRAGVSYNTIGEWMKNYNSKMLGFNGGASFYQGPFSGELTAMWSKRDFNQPTQSYLYQKWPKAAPTGYKDGMVYPNSKYVFNQIMIGLNLSYQVLPNWNHKLTIGYDQNGYDATSNANRLTPTDTLEGKIVYNLYRNTLRYLTTYQLNLFEDFSARATAGVEYSKYGTFYSVNANIKLDKYGEILSTPAGVRQTTLQSRWTAGYNASLEFGYANSLFLTLSSSIKQDIRGADETYTTPPRVGLTYSLPIGDLELRFRGQYGTSIKPVDPSYENPVSTSATTKYIPNYNLEPEQRGGYDAGIELYWGNNASISITRFDEQGKNLIQRNLISTVGTVNTYQYINVGNIKIQGFELQGKLNFGFIDLPFLTLNTNFTYSDNVIGKTLVTYSPTQFFLEGDRVLGTPKYVGGGNLSAVFSDWNVTFDWNFTGGIRTFDNPAWYDYRYGTAVHRDAGKTYDQLGSTFVMTVNGVNYTVSKASTTRSYVKEWPTYFRFNLRGNYRINDMFEVFGNLFNIFNETKAEANSLFVNQGRTFELGVKISY